MRKIDNESGEAFNSNFDFKSGNTQVLVSGLVTTMVLYDTVIAEKNNNTGVLVLNTGGFKSNTTKSRLNSIDNIDIKVKDREWYLNGRLWDGNKISLINAFNNQE